jgi:hypothetical protein
MGAKCAGLCQFPCTKSTVGFVSDAILYESKNTLENDSEYMLPVEDFMNPSYWLVPKVMG